MGRRCPAIGTEPARRIHPARRDTDAAFEEAFDDLAERIGRLAPILDSATATSAG